MDDRFTPLWFEDIKRLWAFYAGSGLWYDGDKAEEAQERSPDIVKLLIEEVERLRYLVGDD